MSMIQTDWVKLTQQVFNNLNDLTVEEIIGDQFTIMYIHYLLDKKEYHQVITAFAQDSDPDVALKRLLSVWNPVQGHNEQDMMDKISEHIVNGDIIGVYNNQVWMINAGAASFRAIQSSAKENVITGPHDAFVESAEINGSLIRRRIRTPKLKGLKYNIGEIIPFNVYLYYIEGVVEEAVVTEAKARLENLHMKEVLDGNQVAKQLDDTPFSLFPQWLGTERPDTVAQHLLNGKVAVLTDNSPTVILAPVNFLEFFAVTGDSYERWHFGRFIRALRLFSFFLTLMLSAFYVAVTTYHYQFIPPTLLETMITSRLRVPFEPMMEALLMEGVIEILREAGARLPTKIAQTIGIVGGLVIGQAIVQAGLTGNVLIVAVASSALASFIIPNYTLETSMRALRFINIVLAGLMGYFGIVIFIALIITRLCHFRSLNKEYIQLSYFADFFFWSKDKRPKSVVQKSYFRRGGRS
ncbi:spore germination protein [Paenibacillus sp. SC116]|uniref:spore germination protein n=1 Tax=Paenibacillus sp. SC116 TaxID=2968986 RepID=UPI00215AC513|nr:spore germination protein [Paenibacillus sp. SC116]MCR8843469.1 spore germination protein [Paenibacillus sp. SC116]